MKNLIADLRPGERLFTLAMLAYFFLVTTTFWILKPLKKSLFVQFYEARGLDLWSWHLEAAEAELLAKLLNVAVAIVAAIAFSALARRLRRHALSLALAGAFVVAFAGYARVLAGHGSAAVWSFYLVGDLFSTVMVAGFFAFLNDTVSPEAAKRLYGPVGVGGVAGGAFGSLVLSAFIARLAPGSWLWICVGLGLAIALVATLAGRAAQALPPESRAGTERKEARPERNPALAGAALVWRSRYLLAIVAIVGLYEIVSSIMDFQFTSAATHYLEGPAIGVYLARVFAITNAVSMVVQLFVTGFVMRRFGVGTALLVLPATAMIASGAFLVAPTLWLGGFLSIADNGFNYSINQSGKEALYVPTTPVEKYEAKAFIDMFMQRFAKTLGIVASLAMSQWLHDFASVRWLSLVSLTVIAVWILAARYAGREFHAHGGGAPSEREDELRAPLPRRDAKAYAVSRRAALEAAPVLR